MRVAILWTLLSGYINSCLKELASRPGVEIFVAHRATSHLAPFDSAQFRWIDHQLLWRSREDLAALDESLQCFSPDVVVGAGWFIPQYRRVMKTLAGKAVRIMTMDTCWRGTLKQRLGAASSALYIRPLADAVWVPGERQAVFARKLGFRPANILRGLYSCDHPAFDRVYRERTEKSMDHNFLFVGRFVEAKGVETLVQAYQLYRSRSPVPWGLVCCGTGPMQALLENKEGIRLEGFVQPQSLPPKLGSAACLIIPSIFEPWALVVHEAVSAGLLVLASDEVGASVHLVQDGYNGYICAASDAENLAALMLRVSSLEETRLNAMSEASNFLSKQFTPIRWADSILSYAAQARSQNTNLC
jgi:glycosyltransferase involved in cell wall biosynthesis